MGCHQSKLAMHEELAEERANASGNATASANTATKNTDTKQQEPLLPVLWDGVSRSKRGQWQQRLADAARAKLDPCERPAETLKRVLEGDALPDSEIQTLGTRQPAIRLFLSSTFTDTEVERNALIEDVYPYLKSLGQRLRVQVYQSSEMRWGIRSEASAAHETSEICMREIKRCQQESSGISYVLILGNKYGFRPFPAKIPEEEFNLLKDEMAKQAKQTASTVTPAALNKAMEYMDEWFVLNENVVPPTRELTPVKKEHSDAWWSDIFPTLQTCLRQAATGAPGLSDERRALYVQSVTAEEIENGLFKVEPKEARDKACFVFDRRLEGIDVALDPDTAKLFIDMAGGEVDEEAQQQLERSRAEAVPAALSPSRIKTMTIPWGPGIDLARTDHAEYMRTFADAFCDTLATDIERVAREHAFESDTVVEEAAAHAMFGNLRRRGFVSTAATQQTVDAALAHVQQRITGGKEVAAPFAICGPSGSGKTSLMAHIAGAIKKAHPAAVVVSRFLGTSRESGTARTLMANVYRHIHRALKGKKPAAAPAADFEKLTEQFQAALKLGTARKPLVLVLDSLDQLSDEDQGRNLEWLPLASLPPNCAIVVSSLPDVGGCWEVLKASLPDTNQQHVAKISKDDADGILSTWLADAKRSLIPAQRSVVLGAYESCPTPLYLRICTQFFALRWTHKDAIAPDFFPKTVEGLMEKVFDELETRHGKETVRAALGYLSASRGGLSDNEMEDLLSCNDTVLDEIYEWWVPPVRRVPPLIWARIVSDLEGALVERGAEGGVIIRARYHRQHREAAERRYLGLNSRSGAGNDTGDGSDGNGDGAGDVATSSSSSTTATSTSTTTTTALTVQRHGELADYFSGRWEHGRHLHDKTDDASALRDRKVASMKTVLAGRLDDPRSGAVVNARKVAVLPFHLMHAQRWEECATTLCDLEFIEAKATAGMVRQLVADFEDLQRSGGGGRRQGGALESLLKKHSFNIWTRFVARNANIFERTPGAVIARASLYPDQTAVFKAAETVLSAPGCRLPRVRQFEKPQQLSSLATVCSGFSFPPKGIAFTRNGKWVCAGVGSKLRAWDANTGKSVLTLSMPGQLEYVCRVVQLPNGHVATACSSGQIHVWNLSTRELVWTVEVAQAEEEFRSLYVPGDDLTVLVIVGPKPQPSSSQTAQPTSTTTTDPRRVHLMLYTPDLRQCVWRHEMDDTVLSWQLRDNTLVAGTNDGRIVWWKLGGAPTMAAAVQAIMDPIEGTLVEVASYAFLVKERELPLRHLPMSLVSGGLDVVAAGRFRMLSYIKADGSLSVERQFEHEISAIRVVAGGGALLALARGMFGITVIRADTLEAVHRIQAPANRIMAATPSGDLLACSDLQQPFVAVYSLEQVDVHAKALTDRGHQQQSLISEPHVAMLAADGASGAGEKETLPAFAVGRDDLGFYDAATMALVHTVALKEHRASALNPFIVLDAVRRKMYKDVITFREIKNTVAVTAVLLCTTTSDDGGDGAAVLATCDGNTIVKLWRLQQEEHPYVSIKVHSGYASSVSLVWLPKQQLLASCAQEQHLLLWNLAGELVRATNLKPAWAFLHPSLKYVVAEAYGGLQFLHASTLAPVFRAYGHDFGLEINTRNKRVRMTPDGRFFVSWAMDDAILVHDFSHLTL
ncbi:hypothetical protein PTSG_02950 [Salpingoeca rosetta]|uniref:NACHT domain-containing protein n=1 Tax=Salpingoeca rosetta (strain ATCC 50818 / BSB-021) TaxID=946362 RepID=F2U3T6_SALR5|nr:uncharacterized protein PTSG_02950 [Salpingoeca rosetta]EGD82280.1 hypothetical protein PTSG_02950 [Salpingoeca rosetta]|eukprot:XP_004996463.1 hypothetical protein PTSG_02950 [Salpingoeca rosetta]